MKHTYLLIVLVTALFIGTSSAAGITLSTDQKDYYFPVGSPAQFQVNISNTYDHPLQGTIQSTTTESTRTAGLSMSRSYTQSQSYTAPTGDSTILIDGGTSDTEKDIIVSLSFDYKETVPESQLLGDITLHFVGDPSKVTNTRQQVVSQSVPPSQGSSGASSTSYQAIQQMVMQQVSSTSQQQSLLENQMPEDTSALKQQLQEEEKKRQANRENFTNTLLNDPTFQSVNESLASQGYSPSYLSVDPQSGDTGTFSSEYTGPGGGRVSVTGSLSNGTAREITEQTSGPLTPPGSFSTNSSYQDSEKRLENEGYSRSGTVINNTPAGIHVNQTYQNPQGRKAYLNATGSLTDVTSVTVKKEELETNYLLPVVAVLLIAILAAISYLVYRKYWKDRPGPTPVISVAPQKTVDFRRESELLLRRAEDEYRRGQHRDAFATTSQALRLFLSCRFGNGAEVTNTEAVALLDTTREQTQEVRDLLNRCTLIEFAKAEPEPGEFERYVDSIRRIIRG